MIPDGWPDWRERRTSLIALGLSKDTISSLAEIVFQARHDQAQYRKPREVRAAIKMIRETLGPLLGALAACPEWTAEIVEACAFVPPPKGPGLREFSISEVKRQLRDLDAAMAAANSSATVKTSSKRKSAIQGSIAHQVVDLMKCHGFPEDSKAVTAAIDATVRTAGFKFKPGKRDGESTARQFLRPEKSRLR